MVQQQPVAVDPTAVVEGVIADQEDQGPSDQDQDPAVGHDQDPQDQDQEPHDHEQAQPEWGGRCGRHGRHGGGRHGGGRHAGYGRGGWGGGGGGRGGRHGGGWGGGGGRHGGWHGGGCDDGQQQQQQQPSGTPAWMEGRKSRFIADVTLPDGTIVAPGSKFTKIWKLGNHGTQDWATGTNLIHVGGDSLLENPTDGPVIVTPASASGGEVDVAVDLVAPAAPGRYISYFRLCGPRGMRFGQRIWVMVVVSDEDDLDDSDLSADELSSGNEEQASALTEKQRHKQQKQAAKQQRKLADITAKAQKLGAKAEQLTARAAKIKTGNPKQQAKHASDPAAVALMEEKVRHIEAKALHFATQAAACQAEADTLAVTVAIPAACKSMMKQLTAEQQQAVLSASLTAAQLEAVCVAVTMQQHLGVVCDATQQLPISGVRFTKPDPATDDTYDLCVEAFEMLAPEDQEQFESIVTPDINLLIKHIKTTMTAPAPTDAEGVPPFGGAEPEPEPETDETLPSPSPAPAPAPAAPTAGSGSDGEFEIVDGDDEMSKCGGD